tara:strand:- start:372 stop:854 length:483 start_codon:yes stop_codon:yes gene_type:complete
MTNLRIGTGYDVHQLKNNLPLLLGGIEVSHNKGIVAHSDGDIIFHALSDALLGAAALGDIGHFFPDTDPAFKNMDSSVILSSVLSELSKLSYQIVNADITIVLERPKLQPHIPAIKKSVAKYLKTQLNQVNIKATTSEKMGFVGKEEGVVCYASVLIEKI